MRQIKYFVRQLQILTFLNFAIAFVLRDQNFQNFKVSKILQKNFQLALTKMNNYKILQSGQN
jgi:hypothetical protein